jgi:hypothetical protein
MFIISVDVPLWIETDGAVQHVKDFIVHNKLSPPSSRPYEEQFDDNDDDDGENDNDENNDGDENDNDDVDIQEKLSEINEQEGENEEEEEEGEESLIDMFTGMYETAIEMAEGEDN